MRRAPYLLFALPLLTATVALAAPSREAPAAPRLQVELSTRADGELVETEGTSEQAELLTFDQGLVPGLLVAEVGEEVRVGDWPVAPGERAAVVLTRRDVYAEDAVIWEVGPQGMRQLPRSPLVFFWGEAEHDPNVRVSVSVDPSSRELRALATSAAGDHELRPVPASWRADRGTHLLGKPNLVLGAKAADAVETSYACGQEQLPESLALEALDSSRGGDGVASVTAAAITSLHTVRVLVETDNELMLQKFDNNTTAATNYLANLFAGMNTMYERDLLVRLVQGTTFLRVSTVADPWSATTTSGGLNELTTYGRSHYGSYFTQAPVHGLVMMLSGKSASAYSAAGIAWLTSLCSSSYGYSFTQVFKFAQDTSANDVRIVGHELGHNFGSPHTHCYSPAIDNCYNGEGGCYSGATSCPATNTYNGVSARGTVMSYCHLTGGCSAANVFHPRTVDRLAPLIEARVGVCVFPSGSPPPPPPPPAPTVTAVRANTGPTTGGTLVTITGTGFEPTNPDSDVIVRFGGTAATQVNVTSSTTLTALTPARATGPVTVSVTNPDGQAGSRANAFFYAPPPAASSFYTVTPCRVVDTRNPTGPRGGPALAGGGSRVFPLTGVCGVPSTAKSVVVNVTVANPSTAGLLEAYPGNAFPLGTTTVAFQAWQNRAAHATLLLATNGTGGLGVRSSATTSVHVVIDVSGYGQ